MLSSSRHHLLTGLVVAACLASVPAHAETLPEVLAYSYANNPGIQAQRAALRALDETFVQARAQFGPTVSATAGVTSYEIRRGGSKLDAETDNVGVSLTQPIYTGGRGSARLSEAQAQIRAGREQLRRAEVDLLQRVVGAYMSVRRDEQLFNIARDTVEVLQRSLEDTETKFRVKTVTMTDVAQSRARLSQAQTQLIAIQEQLAGSRAQFMAIVGRNPGSLAPPPELENLPKDFDAAVNAAEANSPQLLNAIYTEQGSRARVARARAAAMPSITARVDVQRSPVQPYLPGPYDDTRSAALVLSQPLFTSGQIRSGVRQASEENSRDRLLIDDTRLQVLQAVTQSWERLGSLRRQLRTLEEEVRNNELAFYGVRAEERYALRSNIEVLNASAELAQAQQNLARARAAEYVARVQLLGTIGVLSPQTLEAPVRPYDPARNLERVRNKGALPWEQVVIAVDSVASPPIGRAKPASIPPVRPQGGESEPTPPPDKPITSTLKILDKQPGELPPK